MALSSASDAYAPPGPTPSFAAHQRRIAFAKPHRIFPGSGLGADYPDYSPAPPNFGTGTGLVEGSEQEHLAAAKRYGAPIPYSLAHPPCIIYSHRAQYACLVVPIMSHALSDNTTTMGSPPCVGGRNVDLSAYGVKQVRHASAVAAHIRSRSSTPVMLRFPWLVKETGPFGQRGCRA